MNKIEFKDKLFKKLVSKKEFVEDDREKFHSDVDEFDTTWEIIIEMINEEVEATKNERKSRKKKS